MNKCIINLIKIKTEIIFKTINTLIFLIIYIKIAVWKYKI